jgi:hypothetical protein
LPSIRSPRSLAVALIADQIEDVVLDLKRSAHEEAQLVEAIEVGAFAVGHQRTDAHRMI